ncbi:uncharacterized protein BP01DRAFT_378903 [Aspergillus saccharolyticus JOP 1030-1]|uniref:Nucleotide-diphospho-sugar transferase n=1 Tax=Aspergillus saccharolyticus JOP 1030-1 TaxID=1450539 RepID=A0A318ZP69_9EURO|nr:hypothetical protein BP01DRAFT_378903 [Aspergillus saccharolyticus JOP 1030-1]PYH49336.1 hypothetical protein BP01DRAFT_378903 [Aspergillus saccharolyticus JOP 1030-1]
MALAHLAIPRNRRDISRARRGTSSIQHDILAFVRDAIAARLRALRERDVQMEAVLILLLVLQFLCCNPRPTATAPYNANHFNGAKVAIMHYATDVHHLCNANMNLHFIRNEGTQADLVLVHPPHWTPGSESPSGRLLHKAETAYGAKLIPIPGLRPLGDKVNWTDYTKLLAFNLTQYDRVNIDSLFRLDAAPLAAPRAYWLGPIDETMQLTPSLMLIQPSATEFTRIVSSIQDTYHAESEREIINRLYLDSAILLPHRDYLLPTRELRTDNHTDFLGSPYAPWDTSEILRQAKYLLFSDGPVANPWLRTPAAVWAGEQQPACGRAPLTGAVDCRARDLWVGLYRGFVEEREMVCGREFVPQPRRNSRQARDAGHASRL